MQHNFESYALKAMLDGNLDIISALKGDYFTDKYKRIYTLCLEFFEQHHKLPNYDELIAVIESKAPVTVKGAYQALVTGIRKVEALPEMDVIISGITEQHVLRNVDSDIEELVTASRDRNTSKVKSLLNKLNNQVNLAGIDITDMADARHGGESHATVRSFLPKEDEDEFLGGGHSGLTIISASSGGGKALSNDTLIYTPSGTTPIAELKIGDLIYGRNGKTTRVTGVYPQGTRPTYRLTFEDGRSIKADAEHIWTVYDGESYRNITTKHWFDTQLGYSIPLPKPIVRDASVLFKDNEVQSGNLAVANIVHPDYDYLQCSVQQRIEMLRGAVLRRLHNDAQHLDNIEFEIDGLMAFSTISAITRSLGGKCIPVPTPNRLFVKIQLPKYILDRVLHDYTLGDACYCEPYLKIDSIEYIGYYDCTCISVDAEDKLFIAEHFIVTHNTVALLQAAKNNFLDGKNVLFITLELPKSVLYKRLMSSVSGIAFGTLNSGKLSPEEEALLEASHDKFFSKDSPNYFRIIDEAIDDLQLLNIIAVEAQLRNLDVVVLDYIQLVDIGSSGDEWRGISHLAKKLHKLTRTYGITVITASQVNVEGKEKGSIMPKITTRGSRELEFSSTQFLHLEPEPESGGLIMFSKKNRLAECRHLVLEKDFAHMRIESSGLALN